MISAWNTDIKSAPHGRYEVKQRREGVDVRVFVPERVILATKCGKVTPSHYQPEVKRWEMLADGEMPVAWSPYTPGQKLPEHPYSAGMASERMNPSADHVSPPVSQAALGSESANRGGDHVNLDRNTNVGEMAPYEGQTSLAAREGEKPLHTIHEFESRAETHNSHHVGRVVDAQCKGAVAAQALDPHSSDRSSSLDQADSPAAAASLSGTLQPGPRTSGAADGQPGKPSFEAGGAKMDEVQAHPDRAAPAEVDSANSKQAVVTMTHQDIRA